MGIFTAEDGSTLAPGYPVSVGLENFTSIFTNPAIRGPFFTIFIWTFIWAFFSVLETFVLGLLLALNMNSPNIPFQRILRVLLIVPYAIPAFITVKVWVGLLNPVLGIIGTQVEPRLVHRSLLGQDRHPDGQPLAGLSVHVPDHHRRRCRAFQADIYEAARVDGAGPCYQFRRLTLPLLLVSDRPAADRLLRLQLQQLRDHRPVQPGRPADPGRQPRLPATPTS